MKPVVLMHSCSVWPTSVDFGVFRDYLDGYSVEETVERLMTETAATTHDDRRPRPAAADDQNSSRRGTESAVVKVKPSRDCSSIQHEDQRILSQLSDSETVLLPERSAVVSAPVLISRDANRCTLCCMDEPASPATASASSPSGSPTHNLHSTSDDHKHRSKGPHGTKKKQHHHHQEVPTGPATTANRPRTRRHKSFFLNEDYLAFQRRLLQVEGGSPHAFAAALKSQLLFEEVAEQYQLFDVLTAEAYVGRPYSFLTSTYLPFPVEERLRLVQAYYPADEVVLRYLFGDKMTKLSSVWSDLGANAGGAAPRGATVPGLSALQRLLGTLTTPLRERDQATTTATVVVHGAPHDAMSSPLWSPSASSPAAVDHTTTTTNNNNNTGGMALGGRSEEAQASLDLAALSHISNTSLRRQWENIKNVVTTIAGMYRGKNGLFLPRDVPVRKAVAQCYALEGELASSYAAMTFGFEHRLTCKLFKRFHTFAEYETIATILGSVWCDGSMLLLDDGFVEGCQRLCRLLDESRVVAELHTLAFGEAIRPRWQVQLDEVQRAIATASAPDKEAARAAAAVAVASSPMGGPSLSGSPLAMPTTGTPSGPPSAAAVPPSVAMPSSASAATANNSRPHPVHDATTVVGAASGVQVGAFSTSLSGPPHLSPHSPASAPIGSGGGGGATGGHPAANAPVSANKLFSRRLMLEFAGVMKHMARIAYQIGTHENVSDALDVFYDRIYAYLETLSSRAAPGLASFVVQQQQQHKYAMATTHSGGAEDDLASLHGADLAGTPSPTGTVPASAPVSSAGSRSMRRALSSIIPVPAVSSPSSPLAPAMSASDLSRPSRGGGTFSPPPQLQSQPAHAPPGHVMTLPAGVVNASVMQPAAMLFTQPLPLSSAGVYGAGQHQQQQPQAPPLLTRPTSLASVSESATRVSSETHTAVGPHGLPPQPPPPPPLGAAVPEDGLLHTQHTRAGSPAAAGTSQTMPPPSTMEAVVMRALDKRLLRELCQLLNVLPTVWLQLSCISADDHDTCDATFNRLVMALKAVSQVLMATNDFN